jgi:hypothetical protein
MMNHELLEDCFKKYGVDHLLRFLQEEIVCGPVRSWYFQRVILRETFTLQ